MFETKNLLSGQSFEGKMNQEEIDYRKSLAEQKYKEMLEILGYDVENDPNMKNTPKRVVKMYVDEIMSGTYLPKPTITCFPNTNNYDGIIFEGNIKVKSVCSHHIMPFFGFCHLAYIPGNAVIGLSKMNRLVEWMARRPRLQEALTQDLHTELDSLLVGNKGVAVVIEANHTCVSHRGVNDDSSIMKTAKLSGYFFDNEIGTRAELYRMIADLKR